MLDFEFSVNLSDWERSCTCCVFCESKLSSFVYSCFTTILV